MKKVKTIIVLWLLIANISEAQNDTLKTKEHVESKWGGSLLICSLSPHDRDLKDIFGSYLCFQPEARRRLNEDFYFSVNGNLGFGSASGTNIDVNATTMELSAIFEYEFGTGEKSCFILGAGPKISKLNLKLKETIIDTTWVTAYLFTTSRRTELYRYSYSGLGYIVRMTFNYKINKSLGLFVQASYSKVRDEEEDLSIGTTGFGFGILF